MTETDQTTKHLAYTKSISTELEYIGIPLITILSDNINQLIFERSETTNALVMNVPRNNRNITIDILNRDNQNLLLQIKEQETYTIVDFRDAKYESDAFVLLEEQIQYSCKDQGRFIEIVRNYINLIMELEGYNKLTTIRRINKRNQILRSLIKDGEDVLDEMIKTKRVSSKKTITISLPTRSTYIIIGKEEENSKPFITQLAKRYTNLTEAFNSLKPKELNIRKYQRQGEWFFSSLTKQETKIFKTLKILVIDKSKRSLSNNNLITVWNLIHNTNFNDTDNYHTPTLLAYSRQHKMIFVSGEVFSPNHKTLDLLDLEGKNIAPLSWYTTNKEIPTQNARRFYRVFKNTELNLSGTVD